MAVSRVAIQASTAALTQGLIGADSNGLVIAKTMTQGEVAGSRAFGTVYQNTGKTAMIVTVSGSNDGNGNYMIAVSDTVNPPTHGVAIATTVNAGNFESITFVVLPNSYYKVYWSAGIGTVNQWSEWTWG